MFIVADLVSLRNSVFSCFVINYTHFRRCIKSRRMLFDGPMTSILLKEPFALKNSETVYLTIIFSTLSYSDIALIDNFDLIFFYFYFVFEIFGNNSVSIP